MSKSATVVHENRLIPKRGFPRFWLNFKRQWQLHLMILIPAAYLFLFNYVPLYGLQIAFKEYSPRLGIAASPWQGLVHMESFFGYYLWKNLVVNTLALSLQSIIIGYPLTIMMSLLVHMYTGKFLKKLCQNVTYLPHFISLVVMVGLLNTVLNPVSGLLGNIYRSLGIYSYVDIRGHKDAFRGLYFWSGEWQGLGWSTILYLSSLSSVPEELHEAAKLDGASRWRRLFAIDLPTVMPLFALKLILSFGSVLSVGYQKAFLMQNDMNIDVSELISTYIYKQGIRAGKLSFGASMGFFQAIINTILVFVVNKIADVLSDGELGLF